MAKMFHEAKYQLRSWMEAEAKWRGDMLSNEPVNLSVVATFRKVLQCYEDRDSTQWVRRSLRFSLITGDIIEWFFDTEEQLDEECDRLLALER